MPVRDTDCKWGPEGGLFPDIQMRGGEGKRNKENKDKNKKNLYLGKRLNWANSAIFPFDPQPDFSSLGAAPSGGAWKIGLWFHRVGCPFRGFNPLKGLKQFGRIPLARGKEGGLTPSCRGHKKQKGKRAIGAIMVH